MFALAVFRLNTGLSSALNQGRPYQVFAVLTMLILAVLDIAGLDGSANQSQAQGLTDRQILEAFYDATDGANWTTNTNWKSNQDLDSWYGVVTDANDRVTELALTNNGLAGGAPPELGGLSSLATLRLWDNRLTGGIPSELGGLTGLTWLSSGPTTALLFSV